MLRALTGVVAVGALGALAACGGTTTTSSGGGGNGGGAAGSTVSTASVSSLGTVLVNSAGLTLYYLTTEQGGVDSCTNMTGPPSCAQAWPAVHPPSGGSATGGSGVTGTLAVITAHDGTMEVTYNGWPLHAFSGDTAPGQINGNNVTSFGGTWYAVTPSLTASGGAASPSASATPTATGNGYPPGY
jgi:predicted lipoprotein with Yx(FWY)xxD motif